MDYKKVPEQINNFINDNVKALAQLFPSAVKDGQVDFTALKEELGQFEEVDKEKYELTWAGKQDAKKKAQEDVYGRTLKYIEADSKNPDTTENLYIEGDNLEVLKLLRQNYYGAIKMIYIDPPYNTGNDFVYNDNFKMDAKESDMAEGTRDEFRDALQKNQKSTNRFHANWLNMMYPRLKVAKDLLTDDGAIFISIDDVEFSNLRRVCDEIYGEDNFISSMIWSAGRKNDSKYISNSHEYILVYAKNKNYLIEHKVTWRQKKEGLNAIYDKVDELINKYDNDYDMCSKELGEWYRGLSESNPSKQHKHYKCIDKRGVYFPADISWPGGGGPTYNVIHPITHKVCKVPARGWVFSNIERMKEEILKDNIHFGINENVVPCRKMYLRDKEYQVPYSVFYKDSRAAMKRLRELFDGKAIFDYPKDEDIICEVIKFLTESNDIVLDFFSGSATLAHSLINANVIDSSKRKFITVQVPEETDEKSEAYKAGYKNICEIGKERIRRAGEKIKKEIEAVNAQLKIGEEPKRVPDIGFKVFRTADTNIKWNMVDFEGQIDADTMVHTPDLADFTPGFNDIDVVYEVMLRQKDVPLSETLETLVDIGSRTYLYGSAYLVCLETEITEELIDKLAALDPLPIKFVFRDSAFKDDINLKDETFRRLKNLIERNSGLTKKTYTVEFI